MAIFTKSIRWRLLFWLAFLLAGILTGFGVTAYQLHRLNRIAQFDSELERRLTALSADFRGRADAHPPEWPPLEPSRPERANPSEPNRPQGPPPNDRANAPPFFNVPSTRGPGDRPFTKPELRPQTLNLFDEADKNGFYFVIWSHTGVVLKSSTNAQLEFPPPQRTRGDTQAHTRVHEGFRELFHFTERDDCVLVGRSIVSEIAAVHRFAWLLLAAGGAVLAVGLGGGWLVA